MGRGGAEVRTVNRKDQVLNPLAAFLKRGQFYLLHCSLSCINEYLTIDSGGYMSPINLCAIIAA